MDEIDLSSLQDGCGLFLRSGVTITALTGEDRTRYLNGLVTCQVDGLEPGQGSYGFFTDNKGHILSDVVVRALDDRVGRVRPNDASAATVVLTLNAPTKVRNSPTNPLVPGKPTLAMVKTMKTKA